MNHLIAKTKGRNGDYYKVISGENVFALPEDLENPVVYHTDYKLGEDEWFGISDFVAKDYCIDFLKKRFISTEYNQIPLDQYKNIEFLCSYQTGVYFFQKIVPSQFIRKRWLSISNTPSFVQDQSIIVVNSFPDAIYQKSIDTLFFKKLTSITSIFKGIDSLYREATQEETEQFLALSFVNPVNGFTAEKVKKANRKRIAMAMDTLNGFSERQRSSIFKYIRSYCDGLVFDKRANNFSIESEEDLKKLLYGIEQRYYTTILGNERRLANSVTPI